MKIQLFSLLFIFCFFFGKTQNTTLSGYITDQNTGEALVGANIYCSVLKIGTSTNEYGYFSLPIPKDTTKLSLISSYIGFKTDTTLLNLPLDTLLGIELVTEFLQEVVVNAATQIVPTVGVINPSITELNQLPVLLGERDIMKSLTMYPGISSGVEGSSSLYIRGGSPDQNLVLLDGSPIYNTTHALGFLSAFNTDAIKSVKVYKGGIPARYGGRLGGVVDVKMKEGNNKTVKKQATFGLVNSGFSYETPIKRGRSSFLLTGRMAYSALLSLMTYPSYQRGIGLFMFANFYDINAKANFKGKHNDQLFLSFYTGDDFMNLADKIGTNIKSNNLFTWGNKTLGIRYNKSFDNGLFAHTMFNYNWFYNNEVGRYKIDKEKAIYKNSSRVQELSIKQHLSYAPSANHNFFGGVAYFQYFFRPNFAQTTGDNKTLDSLLLSQTINYRPKSIAFFVEYNWDTDGGFYTHNGLRWNTIFSEGNTYSILEPRLKLGYQAASNWGIHLGYDKTHQQAHLLASGTTVFPRDTWLPITQKIRPSIGHQVFLGTNKRLSKQINLNLEFFYRDLEELIDWQDGTNLFSLKNFDWQSIIENEGKGNIYGLECLVEGHHQFTKWWLSYTLSKNTRQFAAINKGAVYPFKYDRLHDLSFNIVHDLNEKWTISGNFVFQTGHPFTLETLAHEELTGDYIGYYYTAKNNVRLPSYHRMDIGLSKQYKNKKGRHSEWRFSIYNLYARKNVIAVVPEQYDWNQYDRKEEIYIAPYLVPKSLFGFPIPSLSYTVIY